MIKKTILSLAFLGMIFSLSGANLMAQENNSRPGTGQQEKQSAFLITGGLPHLTKLLMHHWDNSALNLTEEQKTKLLVVRKETIAGIQNLGPQITPLEKEVTEGIFNGKTPDELHSLVHDIAILKAQATMLHLKCIYDTGKILDQQQLDILMNR